METDAEEDIPEAPKPVYQKFEKLQPVEN